MNAAPVIEIDHLTKYYGTREIVRDLCLTVPPGSIYGFLGRNGMGKTTTIRILLGFEEPTRGRTRVLGEDAEVVDGGLVEFVTKLKQLSGKDIGVHGSIALTQSLLEHGLVNELRLVVAPALQVNGRKLFDKGLSSRLSLTRTITSPSGCLLLDYQVGD